MGVFIAVCVIALGLAVLGITQLMEKGVPLNNAYLYASEKQRKTMNKSPYYRQSGIVFLMLSVSFVFIGLGVWLQQNCFYVLEGLTLAGALLYAIVSTARIYKTEK